MKEDIYNEIKDNNEEIIKKENKTVPWIEKWEIDRRCSVALKAKRIIFSSILGGIVGDVLGLPFEFLKRDTFKIRDMVGYGTHNKPMGTYSDDTSLTMCLV